MLILYLVLQVLLVSRMTKTWLISVDPSYISTFSTVSGERESRRLLQLPQSTSLTLMSPVPHTSHHEQTERVKESREKGTKAVWMRPRPQHWEWGWADGEDSWYGEWERERERERDFSWMKTDRKMKVDLSGPFPAWVLVLTDVVYSQSVENYVICTAAARQQEMRSHKKPWPRACTRIPPPPTPDRTLRQTWASRCY